MIYSMYSAIHHLNSQRPVCSQAYHRLSFPALFPVDSHLFWVWLVPLFISDAYDSVNTVMRSYFIPTGDSAAHGMTDTQGSHKVLQAMSLVSSKAHEAFPNIPIFPSFGNNDLPGHYILPNSSEWYETVLSYWSPLILCSKCPPNVTKTTTQEKLKKTFLDGGYYSVNIASKLLNEQPFSSEMLQTFSLIASS